VGYIRGPHGLRGELKVDPLTSQAERFAPGSSIRAGERTYTVHSAQMHQQTLLLSLRGVTSRTRAEAMRGLLLEVPEADLPPLSEGEYYRYQLIGIKVFDAAGEPLGRIEDIIETGANDVYAVRNAEGELLIPAIDSVVRAVDLPAGRLVVDLPPGLERRPEKRRPRR
jgi:16S rRNA processing protein RimM